LIKNEAPKKSFTMTPSQWCTKVNAKEITFSNGKYSIITFAHPDIRDIVGIEKLDNRLIKNNK